MYDDMEFSWCGLGRVLCWVSTIRSVLVDNMHSTWFGLFLSVFGLIIILLVLVWMVFIVRVACLKVCVGLFVNGCSCMLVLSRLMTA